jgi:Family of unknown function (DUF5367)
MVTQMLEEEKPFNLGLFVLLGAVFWFSGVLFVRLGGEALFIEGSPWLFFLFAIVFPASWVFVKISAVVGKVSGDELLKACVVETLTATLLDGTVLTWFQSIYADEQSKLLLIAAWLLWGGSMGLIVAYWESQRSSDETTKSVGS